MKKLIFLFLLCLTTSTFGQLRQKPMHGKQINGLHPLGDPVGFWLFNEGSGNKVFDLSGNGLGGTLVGTAPSWSAGKFGSAVLLPGTDEYITLPTGILSGAAQCSVSVWAKKSAATDGTTRHMVSFNYNETAERVSLEWDDNFNFVFFFISATGGTGTAYTGNDNAVDVWYHFVGVYDGTNVLLYRNAILQPTTDTTSGPLQSGNFYSNIGALVSWGTPSLFHEGPIDNVSIYNRALSASEIAKLYREPFCMFERDDVALMEAAIPAPTIGGQVIMIIESMTPLFLIFTLVYFVKGRER